jgi:type I restriction enzyme S subunit
MSGLPTSWADIELSVVAQVTSGIGFPNEYQGHTSGDLPFFKVSDISHAVLANRGELKTANHYVSHEVAEKLKGKPLAPGSTVFAKIGEAVRLNRRATVTTPCLIDNNVMAVKARDGVDDRYVHQFLRTIDFGESARSTTVPSLRKGDVEELRFPLAPAAEQKRIADKLDTVLTRVDAVNTRLARVAPLLKRFRQSVLAAATSGRLTEDWRGGRAVNETWRVIPLGKYVENHDGARVPISETLRTERRGAYPYYGASGVIDTIDGFTHEGKFVLIGEDGANLVTRSKPIAFIATGKIWVNNHAHVLKCKEGASDEYLAYYINSIDLTPYVSGSAQPKLNQKNLNTIPVPVPPTEEQTEIVRRVETLFALADRLEARLAQAQTAATRLTPALLAKAFRGELVPQDPNDEPAAELLRRLQAERATAPKASAGRGRKAAVRSEG